MSAWAKMQLWLWAVFSVAVSVFISMVCFVIMGLKYSEMHNTSTSGDHAITERDIILNDIVLALGKAAAFDFVISIFGFLLHREICGSLNKSNRTFNGLSPVGLRLFGINVLILCVGPVVASVQYYLERVPFFP